MAPALEIWEMWITPSLPLLPRPLWPGVVAPDWVLSMGQIEETVQTNDCCPVGWGCRIHRLFLCRGVRPPPNECPRYDIKQSDGEVPVMRSTPSLPLLPGPLWPGVVASDKGLIYGSNRTKLHTYAKLDCLKGTVFDIETDLG